MLLVHSGRMGFHVRVLAEVRSMRESFQTLVFVRCSHGRVSAKSYTTKVGVGIMSASIAAGGDNLPLKIVQFNPVVRVFQGGSVPLSGGGGFWDTRQYENEISRRLGTPLCCTQDGPLDKLPLESGLTNDNWYLHVATAASMMINTNTIMTVYEQSILFWTIK
jgi:hypothetical protein